MMKISEKWSIEGGVGDFILTERYVGKDKKGNEKTQERCTYHATIVQCLNKILTNEIKDSDVIETAEDLKEFMLGFEDNLREIASLARITK